MSRALFAVLFLSTQICCLPMASAAEVVPSCRVAATEQGASELIDFKSMSLKRRKIALRAVFKEFFGSMDIAVRRNKRGALGGTWRMWSAVGRSQMSQPGIFETKVTAATAAHLKQYGPQHKGGISNRDLQGRNFSEDNFFLYWAASVPEPIVSFLARSGLGDYKFHHGVEIREIITDQLQTEEGRLMLMNAVVDGLKRTFVQTEIDKSEFASNVTLPLFFQQMQKAIEDEFSPNVTPTVVDKDFLEFGDAYDYYEPGLPLGSSHYVEKRAEGHYEGVALLKSVRDQALSSRGQFPGQNMGNENQAPADGLRSLSLLPAYRKAAREEREAQEAKAVKDAQEALRAARAAAKEAKQKADREKKESSTPAGDSQPRVDIAAWVWRNEMGRATKPNQSSTVEGEVAGKVPNSELEGTNLTLQGLDSTNTVQAEIDNSNRADPTEAPKAEEPAQKEDSDATKALKKEILGSFASLLNIVEAWGPIGPTGSLEVDSRYFKTIALELEMFQELLIAYEQESLANPAESTTTDSKPGAKTELIFARLETDVRTMAIQSKKAQPDDTSLQRDLETEASYWEFMGNQLEKIKLGMETIINGN